MTEAVDGGTVLLEGPGIHSIQRVSWSSVPQFIRGIYGNQADMSTVLQVVQKRLRFCEVRARMFLRVMYFVLAPTSCAHN